ncbi:dTDP-4-dehydrorhamnose 3,5-epimerase [Roseinatronobacter bogoriensis]|uniref:dTDP-4-dehydrorhamnose 3,5-epimerase n=1 Tax=Roseinatronobacter bogoriensis subsp. barguzinensis TaxID=441209 RepID=A0A2K8KFU4_9RHOB|nr:MULTISPECIES: dTDP-4-dehydrorhamnose 3,5-epimerase [Rhodobaca]ATX65658.1 dTDP-4-dehydrorhamnose 3,5-epimerase [Rhodobaca barguzinensis]MBB4208401.1 dTDP-4-dehydrorhamnose 3,5-epimerase [Rhodobaca bogoriensis DSM 18756]TDW39042.1 dTDP-4-dehydrorhamnose 3,5-epimerase [Rhodobaca barguzinensis]TDY68775.1 dTDP-4-dehydrorhamnose 3,5-epimerase [Rhodobaca bogoriensis DSM 18756]
MIFRNTIFEGAKLIDVERHADARGMFGRVFCAEEFRAQGLPDTFVQQNISVSARRGTLRGMHYQVAPHAEAKLVRCTRGAIIDVILDLRPESSTFMQWAGFELTAENLTQLLVPQGFAHGFQTLADDTEVNYLVSYPYTPAAERGVRWDDPVAAISWPMVPTEMSDKDRNWPDLDV